MSLAWVRWPLLLGVGVVSIGIAVRVLVAGAADTPKSPQAPESSALPTLAESKTVRGNPLTIRVDSVVRPIPVGVTHQWAVMVQSADGSAVPGCSVRFDATMPEHGHGLPLTPHTTGEPAAGRYRIEGVRFSMGGYWRLNVAADCDGSVQRADFELRL